MGKIRTNRKHTTTQEERKAYIDKLRDVPCMDCGGRFHFCAMDFDHIGEKSFGITQRYRWRTMEEIEAEVAKCEVVCSNCHRVRTYMRRFVVD